MKSKYMKYLAPVAAWALPALAMAAIQGSGTTARSTTIADIMNDIKNLLDLAVPIMITICLLYFIYGLSQFILSSESDDSRTEGRNRMIHGVVALFAIVAVWGLVGVVARSFQIGGGSLQGGDIPLVQSPFSSN